MNHVSEMFSKPDRDRIQAAVQAAEQKTSGEIVPFVVEQSDAYEDAEWRGALFTSLIVFCGLSFIRKYTELWIPLDLTTIALATLAAGALGLLAVKFIPRLKTLFAGRHLVDRRVAQRAAEAFISEEVFKTRDRTGILLFVSLMEHRVLVVGDSGINAKVAQQDWHDIVRRIVKGIVDGRIADGLVDAIGQCGALLESHGVTRRPDDTDELPDTLRTSDR